MSTFGKHPRLVNANFEDGFLDASHQDHHVRDFLRVLKILPLPIVNMYTV